MTGYKTTRLQHLSGLLLNEDNQRRQQEEFFWDWLDELNRKPADKKRANKFLLGSILDYQIKAEQAWGNARRLADEVFGDPEDLWGRITEVTHSEWMSNWRRYSLHRYPKAHERVWRIGNEIVAKYDGDARKIWRGQFPATVLERLRKMRTGEQISRMIVGALCDTEQISGAGDVKADIHVCRVLGRILVGRPLSPEEATIVTRKMNPANPWLLDRPLYRLGKQGCIAPTPRCERCFLYRECVYSEQLSSKR